LAQASDKLIVALDYDSLAPAALLASRIAHLVSHFKVGSQLFTAEGPRAVERLAGRGPGIFLDLKFHDIPNTVTGAIAAAAALPGVKLINVHALGGMEMMHAAMQALPKAKKRPKLIAVTVLTSLDAGELRRVGIAGPPSDRVAKLAWMAQEAGLDGVVASAHEIPLVRKTCGKDFLIITPGVRPAGAAKGDQSRVATPAEAVRAGADYIVIGRPITAARDPVAATQAILAEMAAASA
jgi:orotidine-5'-phosphate decarboxylase